ncbi:hypothetical protein CLU79DRAFT_775436 [Phycomyces nitens]|nr:hypothetical protein CLU79DRAFT_775436 [Phycomyces nitens]
MQSAIIMSHRNPIHSIGSSITQSQPDLPRILTIAPSNAVHLSRSTTPTSRRVRSHWLAHFVSNWTQSSRSSKILFILSFVVFTLQVIVTAAVLAFYWDMYCDKPLRVFLVVYIIRLVVSSPFSIYLHIVPDQAQPIRPRSDISMAERGEYCLGQDVPFIPHSIPIEPVPIPTNIDLSRSTPRRRPLDLMNAIRRIQSTLDLFGAFWFLLGNYLVFTSRTCEDTAGPVYYLSLSFIVYGYIIIAFPLLLCIAVVFCLPCVLVGAHLLHVDDAVDMGGATTQEISLLPIYQFKSTPIPMKSIPPISQIYLPHTLPHFKNDAYVLTNKDPIHTTSVFYQFWVWVGAIGPQNMPSLEPQYPIINIPEQDRLCVICLSDYEDDDILCQLWCKHHFHKTCVAEWLVLNSKCPMCKRDCRCKLDPVCSTTSIPAL